MPLKSILLKYWGHSVFRPLQEEIINSVLEGKDTLALLPTGGGKSICFQVPAMYKPGICIVITPLISLMKDQVEGLKKRGIKALAIYSGMHPNEIELALNNSVYGDVKFLYVSPERLESDTFKEHLRKMNVNLIAVDEAHCVSQWGYDFRPPYLTIAEIRNLVRNVPLLALTATATPEVVVDIQDKLEFKTKNLFQHSFERKNLTYYVIKNEDKLGRTLRLIDKIKGSGIIYVRSRRKTAEIADFLSKNGVNSCYYHAGLDQNVRNQSQSAWMNGSKRVIVATNAFGMGIDKSNVRFVIHLDIPDTLEAYFQEAGRAGRDGEQAMALLLFNNADFLSLENNFETSYPEQSFIKNAYNALGNYFQLPVGGGRDMSSEFDLRTFCNQYNINHLSTYSALKFLEKDGYILLSEDINQPSKVFINISKEDLYRFQIENPSYDNFIKTLLRSYGGIFTDFVKINEKELSKRLNTDEDKIIKILNILHKNNIVTFIPQNIKPFIIFTKERINSDDIFISKENYEIRKENALKRIEAIKFYVTSKSKCRSQLLLEYFGEKGSKRCGSCDVCLNRNKMELSEFEFDMILDQVKPLLLNDEMTLEQLVSFIETDEDKILKVMQWLLENDKIINTGEMKFRWNK